MASKATLVLLAAGACSHGAYLDGPFVCGGALPGPAAQCTAGPTERAATLTVCGDLTADNTLTVSSRSDVSAALWVRDNARTTAPLTVQGNYWSGTNQATNTQSVAGSALTGQNLACARSASVADVGWTPIQLSEPTAVSLGTCDYVHTTLDVNNTLDIEVQGTTTLTITGDLHITAPTRIKVAIGASFELVVGGALLIDNTFEVGTSVGQTLVRVGGPIRISAPTVVHGSLFAPESRVEANNTLTVDGAAYVGPLKLSAPVRIAGETAFSETGCLLGATRP